MMTEAVLPLVVIVIMMTMMVMISDDIRFQVSFVVVCSHH